MRAAALIAANVAHLNHPARRPSERADPLRIGVHAGEVIVGDIGFRDRTVFTALGDPVNVAARLQDMTKPLDCRAVISDEVCKSAGIAADALTRTEVEIRGHEKPISVRTTDDPTVLTALVDAAAQASADKKHAAHAG